MKKSSLRYGSSGNKRKDLLGELRFKEYLDFVLVCELVNNFEVIDKADVVVRKTNVFLLSLLNDIGFLFGE